MLHENSLISGHLLSADWNQRCSDAKLSEGVSTEPNPRFWNNPKASKCVLNSMINKSPSRRLLDALRSLGSAAVCLIGLKQNNFLLFVWQRETESSWFNLAAQEIQPLYQNQEVDGQVRLRSSSCSQDVWNGGSSLLLEGTIPAAQDTPVTATCVPLLLLSLHRNDRRDTETILFLHRWKSFSFL